MKNGLIVFNIVLLILVGVLFYLHFSSDKKSAIVKSANNSDSANAASDFRIAFFEMDSVENSFSLVKDVKGELNRKEQAISSELARMEKTYRDKANFYQGKAATMTAVESENATKDMMQLQQSLQTKKQSLDQEYQDFYMRKMREVKTKIEDYLKEYNKERGYSYIFVYEPGLFFYKDSVYNITGDVIKGLNETYSKKK